MQGWTTRRLGAMTAALMLCLACRADPGLDAFAAGEYEQAYQLWSEQLDLSPASPELNYRLGLLYDKGLGTAEDSTRATVHYLNAADQGYLPAMFKLGAIMARQENYKQALKWWRQAAEAGLPEAQYNLGTLYLEGKGVKADVVVAGQWFKKAARTAMEKLGQLKKAPSKPLVSDQAAPSAKNIKREAGSGAGK